MNCLKGSYLSVFLFVAMCDLKCQFNVKEQSESGHVRGASCTSAIWEGGEKKHMTSYPQPYLIEHV